MYHDHHHPSAHALVHPRYDQSAPGRELAGLLVLLTGARGFIGSHLTRCLIAAGAEVHALIRPHDPIPALELGSAARRRVTWHRCDLADPDAVLATTLDVGPEVVFHLASRVQGHRDLALVLPMLEDNTRAAVNVMTAARRAEVERVVLAGSVEEPHGADEVPCSPYAAAKAATTGYARLFADQWDLPVTVLRLAMVYGPGQTDPRKLLPHVTTNLLDGRVPRLGSGSRPIDWVYIDDVCDAFLTAASRPHPAGLVADIGSGVGTTVAATVELLAEIAGHQRDLGLGQIEDRRNDVARIADLTAAAQVLGWCPRTSLYDGLARTLEWHRRRHGCSGPDIEAVS